MKKLGILVALCLVVAMAAPALATEVDFSGTYRVRGILDYNRGIYQSDVYSALFPALDNNQNDWLDHRLRMQVNFKVTDNLKLVTRFDGWDTAMWGTGAEFINWDKIYMEIVSPIGFWRIGRNNAGNWGTDFFGDGGADEDNITWILPAGNWYIAAKYGKIVEGDGASLASANSDYDKWVLSATYRTEAWEAGLLYGFYDCESNSFNALAGAAATAGSSAYASIWTPYFKATFGDLYMEGEFIWAEGEIDFDNPAAGDVDLEGMALYFKGAYTMGPATLWAGYAWCEGDADAAGALLGLNPAPNTWNVIMPLGAHGDFTPLLILWDSNNQMALGANSDVLTSLFPGAPTGLLDYPGAGALNSYLGISQFLIGGTYQVTETVGLGLTIGYAEVDDSLPGIDDDYGWEYDVSLNWQIMDNLAFTSIFAYLDAGDFYEDLKDQLAPLVGANPGLIDVENPMMWYNSLTLSF